LDAIGNTPIAELRKVVPSGCARIVAKLEWGNPTGSMKDRMARAAIEAAERDGRLPPGGTVVEATMGTTGIADEGTPAQRSAGSLVVRSAQQPRRDQRLPRYG
jgi:cysteine synthase